MEKRIILPKTYIENINAPLIFLAGPIRDARDWQEQAINYILEKDKQVIIANPRWDTSCNIQYKAIEGRMGYFDRQRSWEKHYLNIASKTGAILFWLENAPGFMTRLELGQAIGDYKHNKSTRFCVGGNENFSDIDTIRYDLQIDTGKQIYPTLEETCDAAIKLANQRS